MQLIEMMSSSGEGGLTMSESIREQKAENENSPGVGVSSGELGTRRHTSSKSVRWRHLTVREQSSGEG